MLPVPIAAANLQAEMLALPDVETGKDQSGSTAVMTLLSPTHIICSNTGDSRAVLCRGGCRGSEASGAPPRLAPLARLSPPRASAWRSLARRLTRLWHCLHRSRAPHPPTHLHVLDLSSSTCGVRRRGCGAVRRPQAGQRRGEGANPGCRRRGH